MRSNSVSIAACFFLTCLLWVDSPARAASFQPIWGRDGMVVTSVRPAAAAGREMLEKGGTAVDAAIATSFAAAVAHPFSSGLGGGLFAVVHESGTGKSSALDARETAPAGADPKKYRDDPASIRSGAGSVAVPGLVQGLHALHQRYGKLKWSELLQPAIGLAENGVPVSVWHQRMLGFAVRRLDPESETARIQLDHGKVPELGWLLIQSDLAATLRLIQKGGADTLASGEIARRISAATGGAVSENDLAGYQVKWREPIRGTYRGYEIIGMPPPSSGGVLLVGMLNMLEPFDLAALGKNSSNYVHLVAEIMKLAFADRAAHLGDADFYSVPVSRLTSKAYAESRAAMLRFPPSFGQRPAWDQGAPFAIEVQAGEVTPPDDAGTTQISVIDREGNAIAITQTINTIFGSGITVPGTGIVLNNEMDDFSVAADLPNSWEAVGDSANAIVPGKRPLSSMSPTIVLKDGQVEMVVGSPMGTMIISAVLQAITNVIDFGMNAEQAVQSPRFHHQWKPATLFLEPEFVVDVKNTLEAWGHTLGVRQIMGAAELIVFDRENCYYRGGADGRRDSGALAANLALDATPGGQRAACLAVKR